MTAASLNPHEMLAQAGTIAHILAIAQDFVERLDPLEIEALPASCKPRTLGTAVDISDYAYDLKRCACESAGNGDDALGRLTLFFSNAALRITTLTGPLRSELVPGVKWSKRTRSIV